VLSDEGPTCVCGSLVAPDAGFPGIRGSPIAPDAGSPGIRGSSTASDGWAIGSPFKIHVVQNMCHTGGVMKFVDKTNDFTN